MHGARTHSDTSPYSCVNASQPPMHVASSATVGHSIAGTPAAALEAPRLAVSSTRAGAFILQPRGVCFG